jgi:Porin PorA
MDEPVAVLDTPGPPPLRPRPPRTVVLAAAALALHALAPLTLFTPGLALGSNVVAGYRIVQGALYGIPLLLVDVTSFMAYALWEVNDGDAAAVWVAVLVAVQAALIVLILRGTHTGWVAANVFSALTLLALVPVLSVAVLILLNRKPSRRFFRETLRWRRNPARVPGTPPRWPAVAGVLSLLAAAVSVWVVAPGQVRLGGDATLVRVFSGSAKVLVDPAALARGEVAAALRRDARLTAGRIMRAQATDGSVVQVRDTWIVKAGHADWTSYGRFADYDGAEVSRLETSYAVDRVSMQAADSHPRDWSVADHRGLALDWPTGARPKDYPGWVPETAGTTTLHFIGRGRHSTSRYVASSPVPRTTYDTYRYQSTVEPTPITDQRVLAGLPRSLPVATVSALAAMLLPAGPLGQLTQALSGLTGTVPVDYTYAATASYAVEPTSGIVVGSSRTEIRRMNLSLPSGAAAPPIVISEVSFEQRCNHIECAAVEAWQAIDRNRLWRTTVPVLLLTVGAIGLTVTGVARFLLCRPSQPRQVHGS